jgi:hypothetical protein
VSAEVDLPRLVCELHPAGQQDRAYARYMFSATRVVVTREPARIRRHAHELLALADSLELELAVPAPGQQALEVGG